MLPAHAVRRLVMCASALLVCASAHGQAPRKIGELQLSILGLSAAVDPAAPVIPRNTPAGVRVVVASAAGEVQSADLIRFFGSDIHVEGDLTGAGLSKPVALSSAAESNRLLLRIPALQAAGDYQLSNLRLVSGARAVLDVTPGRVPVRVIEQVLITSVTTRPLTLDEIKSKGIVLDRDDYLAFEFTMGVKLESRAVQISFPAVFTAGGKPLPELTYANPQVPSPELDIPSLPMIVPTMLVIEAPGGGTLIPRMMDGTIADVRIPSVLVIPGNVGYLRQFFSAQLFVANGAPGGSRLTVRDLTGTIRLPNGDDGQPATGDDPLSPATVAGGPAPAMRPVMTLGPDGAAGTGDDGSVLQPGEQAQAEFLVRGNLEGFHELKFDIEGVLDGLATGPATVRGSAKGGVLVRNPYFDMTFTVPSVVRRGEPFSIFVTVRNKSESGPANDLTVALDQSRMSGMHLTGEESRQIPTLVAGDARTLEFRFVSDKTGQVVASYLRFEGGADANGQMRFSAGIGDRGIALSPDTLLLPTPVDALPTDLVDAAMRVLGQAWSISLAADGTLPAGVLPIKRTKMIAKAQALAEAALRVRLGQPLAESLRDFANDFYGPTETSLNAASGDPGFDQLLRTTDAGAAFTRALGGALTGAIAQAGGVLAYQREWAERLASGSDRVTFATTEAPVDVAVIDGAGQRTAASAPAGSVPPSAVPYAFIIPAAAGADAARLGLIAQPAGGPYTIELTGRAAGVVGLAVSLPRGDGSTTHAEVAGLPISPARRVRLVIDLGRPDRLLVESDADGDGTFEAQYPMVSTALVAGGARLVSANVVGPEAFPNAGRFGKHAVLLFDRVVDGTQASNTSLYSVPKNRITRAQRILSGRLAVIELEQPEGPHVPATFAVTGVADLRGAIGPPASGPLGSLLVDAGAVVSGRVFTPDGIGVGGVDVYYSNSIGSPESCEFASGGLELQQARLATGADGAFEFRWVRKDETCGIGFQLLAQDPRTGSLRRLYSVVRADGEHIVLDLGLFGRGTVTGLVRDTAGNAVGGAQVVVVSDTDPRIAYSALADAAGRYTIPDVLVGPLNLKAAKAYDNGATVRQGVAAGRLATAGGVETIDITIDTASASVSGVVLQLQTGTTRPVPGALVLYSAGQPGGFYRLAAGVLSGPDGRFSFPSVPAGPFRIEATLPTILREQRQISGFVGDNDVLEDLSILVETAASGTVRGRVRRADNTPVARAMVREGDHATFTDANGLFTLTQLEVRTSAPHSLIAETPDRRKGSISVFVTDPNVPVENVEITVSALGSAEFTVLDPTGAPVIAQDVSVLADQFGLRGACALGCGCAIVTKATDAQGKVRFDDLASGAVLTRAIRNAGGFIDAANGRATIVAEGQLAHGVMRFEGFGSIDGVVLDPDGRASVGTDVTVRSRRFDKDSCTMTDAQPSYFVRTDYLGRFALPAVGVGPVSITAKHPMLPVPVGTSVAITSPGETLSVSMQLVDSFAGELSGRILLPDGVTPAGAGVEVTINGPLPDITVRTGEAGEYAFAKILPAGTYTMTAVETGSGAVAQESIHLQAGQDLVHEMRLKGRGTVRVHVIDALGAPVPGAVVRLTETAYPRRVLEGVADTPDGRMVFERIFEGPVAIAASDAFGRGGRVSATLPAPDADIDVNVRLSVTGTIHGRFLMPDGTPIPYGVVTLRVSGRVIGQATTAGSGEVGAFEFTYVPAGPARLEASDPRTARTGVAVGAIATEGETVLIDVRAQGLGAVTGVITAGGAPQAGAAIDLVAPQFQVKALADADGRYTIDGVPEGLVSVTATVDAIQTGTASATLSGDGTVLTLDVAVRDTGRLTGTVIPAGGTALPPVIVSAQAAGLVFSTAVDANGRFEFPRLPAGPIVLTADAIASIDTGRLRVTLPGSTTTDVQLPLRGVGSVSGVTLDSGGHPVGGVLTLSGGDDVAGRYSVTITVGADGAFLFPELLAGPVSARLRVQIGTSTLYGSGSATVLPGQQATLEVRLQDSATITGVVLRSDGTTPAVGADAVVKLAVGPQVPVQVQADGRFVASGVPLGAFTIAIEDQLTGGMGAVRDRATTVNGETLDVGTIVLDDTPLVVTAVDPPDGSTAVGVDKPIVLTLSDPLQSATGASVRKDATVVAAAATLSNGGSTLTLSPSGATKWPDASEITVTVSTAATDIYGRHPTQAFTSRFHTVDLSPPSVVSTVPAAGAIDVPGTTAVALTFNEPLSAATDLGSLVVVMAGGGAVSGVTTLTSPTVATFTPASPFAENLRYSIVANGAIDASGNVQTTPYAFSFATHDTIAPVLTVELPTSPWQRGARPYIQIAMTDNASGVAASTATLLIDGAPVAVQRLETHLVYTPAVDLAQGLHTVDATVRDLAGNTGTLSFPLRIDGVAPETPVLTGVAPNDVLRGTFTVGASSSDATSGLAKIRFFLGMTQIGEATAPPYQIAYDAGPLPDGAYELRARADDVAGNDSGFGPAVSVVVDNDPLILTIVVPGTPVRDAVPVGVTPSEPVSRIDFTVGSVTVSDTTAPYEQTVDLTGVPEGPARIDVTGYPTFGAAVTTPVTVTVDRTPPAPPDGARITAEPPGPNGLSSVRGAVEAEVKVEVSHVGGTDVVSVSAGADGSFSTVIAAQPDDLLSVVAVDAAKNRSAAAVVAVRRTPSLPPAEGSTSLRFDGLLADRIGGGTAGLGPDGLADAVFTLTLSIGDGLTRQLSYIDLQGPAIRSTRPAIGSVLGVAADPGASLLNGADGSVSLSISGGATLTLFAHDAGFIQPGTTYTATAVFTDGSRFVGRVTIVADADRAQIAHSLSIAASPPTVVVAPGMPGTTTLTLSDIRDINGTRVADGARVALSAADMATRSPIGSRISSIGGEILDGEPAANNASFRVFTISGGTVTATYSSGTVSPAAINGPTAVVQVLAANAGGQVLGEEAIGSIDINVRPSADRAIVHPAPASVYVDTGDRRSTVRIEVRDAAGNPVPDGTRVLVTAAGGYSVMPGGTGIASAGGRIVDGTASPTGDPYRVFTVSGGAVTATYSALSPVFSFGSDVTRSAVIQVLPADAAGARTSMQALGTGVVTLAAAGGAEVYLAPQSVPYVFPAEPVSVLVHHVHDARGNLVPDGAGFLLTATSGYATVNGTGVPSAGGGLLGGQTSPTAVQYRAFALESGQFGASYTIDAGASAMTPVTPGNTATANISLLPADPARARLTMRAIAVAPVPIVAPTNAVGVANPPSILADGGTHTSSLTFRPVLDAYGDPVPAGSLVLGTAQSGYATTRTGTGITSAGGQLVNGTVSPTGQAYKVFTAGDGSSVDVTYADQQLQAAAGEIAVANISLVESYDDGSRASMVAFGTVPVELAGTTTASAVASPALLRASGDRHATVTFSGFRDAAGEPVPDGTTILATAAAGYSTAGGSSVPTVGGAIVNGNDAAAGYTQYRAFTIQNGQIVVEYSGAGLSLSGPQTASIQLVPATPGGVRISTTAIATAGVRLVTTTGPVVEAGAWDLTADGSDRRTTVVVSGLALPDGAKVGLTAANNAAGLPSAGGMILSGGVSPGDGALAPNDASFSVFTVVNGEVHAVYSAAGVTAAPMQTRSVQIAVVAADAAGNVSPSPALASSELRLRGVGYATPSGVSSLSAAAGATGRVTFSGIKDAYGNTVADGTRVLVTAANCGTTTVSGTCNTSAGGAVLDGDESSYGPEYRVFTVRGGRVTVTLSSGGLTSGVGRVQIAPLASDGSRIGTQAMTNGVRSVSYQQ